MIEFVDLFDDALCPRLHYTDCVVDAKDIVIVVSNARRVQRIRECLLLLFARAENLDCLFLSRRSLTRELACKLEDRLGQLV